MQIFGKTTDFIEGGDYASLILKGDRFDELKEGMLLTADNSRPLMTTKATFRIHVLKKVESGEPVTINDGDYALFYLYSGMVVEGVIFLPYDEALKENDYAEITVEFLDPVMEEIPAGAVIVMQGQLAATGYMCDRLG